MNQRMNDEDALYRAASSNPHRVDILVCYGFIATHANVCPNEIIISVIPASISGRFVHRAVAIIDVCFVNSLQPRGCCLFETRGLEQRAYRSYAV